MPLFYQGRSPRRHRTGAWIQIPPVTGTNVLLVVAILCFIFYMKSYSNTWTTDTNERQQIVSETQDAAEIISGNARIGIAEAGGWGSVGGKERPIVENENLAIVGEDEQSIGDVPAAQTRLEPEEVGEAGGDDLQQGGQGGEESQTAEIETASPPPPQESDCKMNFAGLSHKEKLAFFEAHPECNFLNSCDAILEPTNQTHLVREMHSTYVFRYTDDIRYSHMAMVERLPNRLLVAVWQAAPSAGNESKMRLGVEGLDSQHILISHSRDEYGKRWSTPQEVPLRNTGALWSPVLHVDHRGVLWLFYSESTDCRKAVLCTECRFPPCELKDTSQLCHTDPPLWVPGGHIKVVSSVGPLSQNIWTPSRTLLTQQAGGVIPKVISNRVTVLASGEWLLPYWREQAKAAVPTNGCLKDVQSNVSGCVLADGGVCMTGAGEHAGVLISTDAGASWQAHGQVASRRTTLIEGSLVQLNNRSLFMTFRTTTGCLFSALSNDKGYTWSEAQSMAIPNPNSKVHMLMLEPGGQLLLAFNNHRPPGAYRGLKACKACRTRLHLAMSDDNGDSWRHVYSVDDEVSSSAVRLHYPCLVQIGAAPMVALVYSRFYLGRKMGLTSLDQGVRFTLLDMEDLLAPKTGIFGSFFGK